MKSFLGASESHRTSANLSVRAYFRQFFDWWERHFGHSQESPGRVDRSGTLRLHNAVNILARFNPSYTGGGGGGVKSTLPKVFHP